MAHGREGVKRAQLAELPKLAELLGASEPLNAAVAAHSFQHPRLASG